MNENEQYIFDAIKSWVWSGFYSEAEMKEMVYDILEENCDEQMLLKSIGPELTKKIESEKFWPETTDYEKLHKVFYELHEYGVCALHNAGYTMSEGYSDVSEVVSDAPADHYRSYCFYHGQDVESAVVGNGLMIAFGSLSDAEEESKKAGEFVVEKLKSNGFSIEWDGSTKNRIFIPSFIWQKRA